MKPVVRHYRALLPAVRRRLAPEPRQSPGASAGTTTAAFSGRETDGIYFYAKIR